MSTEIKNIIFSDELFLALLEFVLPCAWHNEAASNIFELKQNQTNSSTLLRYW